MTGGGLEIISRHKGEYPDSHGTVLTAWFFTDHIDFTPLGDVTESIVTLIQGHPDTDFLFKHNKDGKEVLIDTRQLREILGDVPLDTYDVICWVREYMNEQYSEL